MRSEGKHLGQDTPAESFEKDRAILGIEVLGKRLPMDVKCVCGCYADNHNDSAGNLGHGECKTCPCEMFKSEPR